MNNKEIKSDWWFFSNITLASIGIGFIFFLITVLVGLVFTVTLSQTIAVLILFIMWAASVYGAVKVAFLNAILSKKDLLKVSIYNFLLYLVLMLRIVPFAADFANNSMNPVVQNYVLPLIISLIMSAFTALMIYNNLEEPANA